MSKADVTILKNLGRWAICQDLHGVFYYDVVEKQAYDKAPPGLRLLVDADKGCAEGDGLVTPAMNGHATVQQPPKQAQSGYLRQIGPWVVSAGQQGTYYKNVETEQVYEEPPPELLDFLEREKHRRQQRQMMRKLQQLGAKEPKSCKQRDGASHASLEQLLLQKLSRWAVGQENQHTYFQNLETGQVYDEAPPELLRLMEAMKQVQQQQPAKVEVNPLTVPRLQVVKPLPGNSQRVTHQHSENSVRLVRKVGDWAIFEDAQGAFYQNLVTKQVYSTLPPELAGMLRSISDASEGEAQVLKRVGRWALCKDGEGLFYYDTVSKQSFDTPPAELELLLQKAALRAHASLSKPGLEEMQPKYVETQLTLLPCAVGN